MSVAQLSGGGGGDSGDGGVFDLSTKSDHPPQECQVKVDIKSGNSWVRIPVTLCELWANKDGPADVTRTAKVKFPAEWNGDPITHFVNGFTAQADTAPYDECRIWFYDNSTGQYEVVHYGYVGGVGPAAESGVMKMWVYDPADLMRGIQVSKTFGDPTIQQVLDFVLQGEDETGREVGIEHRSVFGDIKTFVSGLQEVELQKKDSRKKGLVDTENSETRSEGTMLFSGEDLIDDIWDDFFGSEQTQGIFSQKRFQVNRNNMVDLMNWFAGEVGGKWQFEPTRDGPVLFFDNTSSRGHGDGVEDGDFTRRVFVDNEVPLDPAQRELTERDGSMGEMGDISDYQDRRVFDTVDVVDNNALYDIKPFNTLYLYGESDSDIRYSGDSIVAGAPSLPSREFPYVKAQYEPLVQRAGGYEYSAPPVESDAIMLSQAEAQAKTEFRKHLEEQTEGKVTLRGEPYLLPYDYLKTVPTCNDTYTNADIPSITYEVNGVKHRRAAGEQYTTEVGVSLVFDESKLTIESDYMEG